MHVGICKITLRLPENQSLKGKRHVINSLTSRLRQKFNIAVAEIDHNDLWQLATLGLVCVSNDNRHVNEMISQIHKFIIEHTGEYVVIKQQQEIISGF